MLSDLPKIISKSFAIGFALPSMIFFCGLVYLITCYCPDALYQLPDAPVAFSIGIILVWSLSVLLMIVDRFLIRFLEGYGALNPLRVLVHGKRRKFEREALPIFNLAKAIDEARDANSPEPPKPADFTKTLSSMASLFPPRENLVLPTRFGNIMRAFELYSREIYGMDAIAVWPRLAILLPADTREQVQESRSSLDFFANLLAISVTLEAIHAAAAVANQHSIVTWFSVALIVCAAVSWRMLGAMAMLWGEEVKSVFDVHRFLLAKQLGLTIPLDVAQERQMWNAVNCVFLFRSEAHYRMLKPYRSDAPTDPA